MKRQETNQIEIDLSTSKTVRLPFEENSHLVTNAAGILTNKFLDYVRAGGNVKNLTPDKIFGRKDRK